MIFDRFTAQFAAIYGFEKNGPAASAKRFDAIITPAYFHAEMGREERHSPKPLIEDSRSPRPSGSEVRSRPGFSSTRD